MRFRLPRAKQLRCPTERTFLETTGGQWKTYFPSATDKGPVAQPGASGRALPEASRDDIVAAAGIAQVHDFITAFPDGYDTLIGKRGQCLSGGERQQISIARAVLHNPRILILDEATSALDLETEARIHAALATLTEGRTVIDIAHRLATLSQDDRLVVLDRIGSLWKPEAGIGRWCRRSRFWPRPGCSARFRKAKLWTVHYVQTETNVC